MALSGLQIYKLLPQTNCKECNFPSCVAVATKLADKQAELFSCPYVSEDAKTQLASAAAPPIRLVTLSSNGHKVAAGNETVLFRHEKTFYHAPGLFVRVRDTQPAAEVKALAEQVAQYKVDYVGIDLAFTGMAVQSESGDPEIFKACVAAVRSVNKGALIGGGGVAQFIPSFPDGVHGGVGADGDIRAPDIVVDAAGDSDHFHAFL